MYKRLNGLISKDETLPKLMKLKQQLDVIRIEILNIYRSVIYKNIKDILENKYNYYYIHSSFILYFILYN